MIVVHKFHNSTRYFQLLLVILLLPEIALAADYSRALLAMEVKDYKTAAEELSPLAQQGDAVAAYNLNLVLRKLNVGPAQSNEWLQQSSRKGLVNAYNQLNAGVVRAAVNSHAIIVNTPEDWIREQNPGHYTLQLASSKKRKQIDKYYTDNKLTGQAGYYRNRRNGVDWYALVYGSYATMGDAKAAAESLPPALRKWSPWVRRIKDIQRIMQPLDVN